MFDESATLLLPVATQVVIASSKGAVAIAFVLLCRKLFATRLSAHVRRGLWLVVLAALLLPVGVDLPIELQRDPLTTQTRLADVESPATDLAAAEWTVPSRPDAAIPLLATQSNTVEMPPRRISFQLWMVLLWATVVVVLAAITVSNLLRFRRIVAQAKSVSGPALELLLACKTSLELHRHVRLLESADIASPAASGWLSPKLLLPPGSQERLDATQLRHVFLHELAHVQRHDILVNWLMTGAQVLHWFNPVVWYGLRVMRSDMEQACDARVLAHLSPDEHADYGHTLIGVWDAFPGRTPAHGLGVVESHGQLKERITMIAKFSSRKSRSPLLTAILLLGLASVAATQPRITSETVESVIERASIQAPLTPAAVLMTQAAQPAAAASPTAAAVPKQPATDPGYTPDEAQEAKLAFSILGRIVRSGLEPDSKLDMSSLGLFPEDPRTLLPLLSHLMDEYWQQLDERNATLCRHKDLVTIEMFTDAMRARAVEKDAWQVRKWREFLASLSTENRTPRAGEPRRFWMSNMRLGTAYPVASDQEQFNNFIEWRNGGCEVAAGTEFSPAVPLPAQVVIPAARVVDPFTVRLLPPEITGADDAVKASLQKSYLSLAAKLGALPGLMLLTPDTVGHEGDTINYQIGFNVAVRDDGRQLVTVDARTLSRPFTGISAAPRDAAGQGSSSAMITRVWSASGRGNGAGSDPERDLDNLVEAIRVVVFHADPPPRQNIRLGTGEALRFGPSPDPALISSLVDYARTETDPGRRAAIWRRLGDLRTHDFLAPLVQALANEKDEKARIQLAINLASNYRADPVARVALQSVLQADPPKLTRMIVQHLLTGDAAWSNYVIATLKNPDLTDAQRIEPLSYARSSSGIAPELLALDDEAMRILGSMLADQPQPSQQIRNAVLMQLSNAAPR